MPNVNYPNLDQTTHGESNKTPEYKAWKDMIKRCYQSTSINWGNYGDRGIKVCQAWHSYLYFLKDMGRKPSPKYSLDRIDNNANYGPNNCRWSTAKQQAQNRRTSWNIKGTCLKEVCEQRNMPYKTIWKRLKLGWTLGEALQCPIAQRKKK